MDATARTIQGRKDRRMSDLISRQAAISAICNACGKIDCDKMDKCEKLQLPPANCSEFPNNSDTFSRQDMVSRRRLLSDLKELITAWEIYPVMAEQIKGVVVGIGYVELIPSAQPERTCVNCGRTANNGGWYADGRTRCPIEEHYALPKDGFCHLWEKRNVTYDDYPERRTDEE